MFFYTLCDKFNSIEPQQAHYKLAKKRLCFLQLSLGEIITAPFLVATKSPKNRKRASDWNNFNLIMDVFLFCYLR